jgi:dUTPase
MKMGIINKSRNKLPEYNTEYSAVIDIRENTDKDIVLDSPGTIDADYRDMA